MRFGFWAFMATGLAIEHDLHHFFPFRDSKIALSD